MKTSLSIGATAALSRACRLVAITLCLAGAPAGFSQGFQTGSDGSYGPLNVTSNTVLDMPTNGIFNCTTINVSPGLTLKFNRNPLNTPVYLLATGDVTISGIIDVSGENSTGQNGGKSGPGGFDGGTGGFDTISSGAGQGPGAGRGQTATDSVGHAGYALPSSGSGTNQGAAYGSKLLMPLVGGSGGGGSLGTPGSGGGGGGGAILIASPTKIVFTDNRSVIANGGNGAGSGSGGAIRLIAPRIEGSPSLNVSSPNGGIGRIRVDVIERDALNLSFNPAYMSLGSFMKVFPDNNPRLDITQAAGTNIAEGAANPVIIELPFGSGTNRTVTVQARNFGAAVPIRVTLTPEGGIPLTYDTTIDNAAANPASATVNVAVPVNTRVAVHSWTR